MSVIYLIRHGQASFGAADYDRLSPLGERQADIIGAYFAATGINFDIVYSGELNRQIKTCEIAMKHQPIPPPHHIDGSVQNLSHFWLCHGGSVWLKFHVA